MNMDDGEKLVGWNVKKNGRGLILRTMRHTVEELRKTMIDLT
jgi:hypothetical protein